MIINQSIDKFWKPKMRTPRGWKSCYTTDPPPCQKKGPCLFSLKDGGRSEYLRGLACNRKSLKGPGFAYNSEKSGGAIAQPPSGSTGPYLALDRTQVLFHAAMIPTNWKNTGFFCVCLSMLPAAKGSFFNQVDQILLIIEHLPTTPFDIGDGIPLMLYGKICITLTFPVPPTYLPCLVNVVKERPLSLTQSCFP